MSVLVLDAPVDEVVEQYARQWTRWSRSPGHVTERSVGEAHLTDLWTDVAGGDMWNLLVVEEPGRPTFGLVDTGTDP
jgi:hypothetical protein